MEYRDYFQHIERKIEQQRKEESRKEKVRRLGERLAEELDISSIEALRKLSSESLLQEWMEVKKQKPEKRKKSVDSVIERLKDEADAPSVGDEVKIQFDEEARGHLTPQQENLNGAKGTVRVRDPFRTGSQRARYTVEVHGNETESGEPYTIHNLTPGEVVSLDSKKNS